MKTLKNFLIVTFLIISSIFFNSWIWMKIYELGIVPLVSFFNYELPLISYGFFVMLYVIFCILFSERNNNKQKYTLDDNKLWSELLSGYVVKLYYILFIWIINLIIF